VLLVAPVIPQIDAYNVLALSASPRKRRIPGDLRERTTSKRRKDHPITDLACILKDLDNFQTDWTQDDADLRALSDLAGGGDGLVRN